MLRLIFPGLRGFLQALPTIELLKAVCIHFHMFVHVFYAVLITDLNVLITDLNVVINCLNVLILICIY